MNEDVVKTINYENIRVNGYNLERIEELKIYTTINEHAVLKLTGILKNEDKDSSIHSTTDNKTVEVYYIDNEKKTLFYGVVTNIEITVDTDVYMVNIEAKSMSYLTDIKVKSRSFQNKSMTTHELVSSIMGEYNNSNITLNIPNEPVNELLIQYEETDWEFLKRIASKYNQGLFPVKEMKCIECVMGIPEVFKELKSPNTSYEVYKDVEDYKYMLENYLSDANEADYTTYKITKYELLNLGDNTNLMNMRLYVYEGSYEIKDGILENTYKLRLKNGLRQKKLFNTKVIGTSINGKIIGVQNDVVQIHLDIDSYQDISTAYWFKFSTMSASSDGSGWYYMPEIGDSVKAYFPTKDEDETFAISAVSEYKQGAGEAEDRMGNPDDKYLRTVNDKQVKLTPNGIFVSCNSGQAEMNLTNDGTLTISSQNNIDITAEENLRIEASKDFLISAKQSINISCDQSGALQIDSDGNVNEFGSQVKNN